jgi:hypothetical protein
VAPGEAAWSIIPAHEVTPDRGIVAVGGKQPIAEDVLVGEVCAPGIVRNIDPRS